MPDYLVGLNERFDILFFKSAATFRFRLWRVYTAFEVFPADACKIFSLWIWNIAMLLDEHKVFFFPITGQSGRVFPPTRAVTKMVTLDSFWTFLKINNLLI